MFLCKATVSKSPDFIELKYDGFVKTSVRKEQTGKTSTVHDRKNGGKTGSAHESTATWLLRCA